MKFEELLVPAGIKGNYWHRRVFRMLAFVVVFLNYLQTFEGVLVLLYSSWMLTRWIGGGFPVPPPPHLTTAPWFIFSFMGFGVALIFISFAACLAVTSRQRLALCLYELLVLTLLSTEAVMVTYIRVDDQWQQNLPYDPTGQINTISSFVKTHARVCKRIGVTTIMVQVFSLLLTFFMRLLVIIWAVTVEVDDCEKLGGKTREPLLISTSDQISDEHLSEIFNSLMNDKYNNGEKYTLLIQNAPGDEDMKTKR